MQYYDGLIYFLDRANSTIYSMDKDGLNRTVVLNREQHDLNGSITEFVIIEDEIYFVNVYEHMATLKMVNIVTNELDDMEIMDAIIPSLSEDETHIYFSQYLFELKSLERKTGEISMPTLTNLSELQDTYGHRNIYITYRTVSNQKTIFPISSVNGSPLIVINEKGEGKEIHFDEGFIPNTVNAFNEWVYFSVSPPGSLDDRIFHLYRIRNDGSGLERIFTNIVEGETGIPYIFLNIFSEDLILFKIHATFNTIYALVRNPETNEMERITINP
jgi:hypothetical protein